MRTKIDLNNLLKYWEEAVSLWRASEEIKRKLGRPSQLAIEGALLHYDEFREELRHAGQTQFDESRFTHSPESSESLNKYLSEVAGVPKILWSWVAGGKLEYCLPCNMARDLAGSRLDGMTFDDLHWPALCFIIQLDDPLKWNNIEYSTILVHLSGRRDESAKTDARIIMVPRNLGQALLPKKGKIVVRQAIAGEVPEAKRNAVLNIIVQLYNSMKQFGIQSMTIPDITDAGKALHAGVLGTLCIPDADIRRLTALLIVLNTCLFLNTRQAKMPGACVESDDSRRVSRGELNPFASIRSVRINKPLESYANTFGLWTSAPPIAHSGKRGCEFLGKYIRLESDASDDSPILDHISPYGMEKFGSTAVIPRDYGQKEILGSPPSDFFSHLAQSWTFHG